MRELFIEQKKLIRISCYKESKFAINPGDPLDIAAKKKSKQDCDFGFQEITPLCKNCIWFQITEVSVDGRPAVSDRVIDKADVGIAAIEYREQDTADPTEHMRIAQEKAAAIKVLEAKQI